MCQAKLVFRLNWTLVIEIRLEKNLSEIWLVKVCCYKMSDRSIRCVLILLVIVEVKLSMIGKDGELASGLKQNLPSILEVVEFASVRQYPSVSVC